MGLRFLLMMGVSVLAVPSVSVAEVNSDEAASNWAAVADCAQRSSATARHECVDAVLRRTGVLDEQKLAQAARSEFGVEGRPRARGVETAVTPAAPAVQAAPASAVPARPSVAAPARAQDIERLVTTVTAVRSAGYNRYRVTTAEGAVWEQTQAEDFNTGPRAGDRFVIERGAIGGFRCQFRQASLYRCARVD